MKGGTVTAQSFPEKFEQTLITRHRILKKIRQLFDDAGYVEVETPLRVRCPGIDLYIDAIGAESGYFLSTSPELLMKRLLTLGMPRIYQITHAFRAHEQGAFHNTEFSLLEWYRVGTNYRGVLDETEELVKVILKEVNFEHIDGSVFQFPFSRISVDELFESIAGWKPSRDWNEDRYFLDWVEKIEPFLASQKGVFITDFPSPLSSLAKISPDNPRVCERFELFMDGLEIANAFSELTDAVEQDERFKESLLKRKNTGKELYEIDHKFIQALRDGMPECAGVALGIDRLIMAILGYKDIALVQTFPAERL
ncbi:MAG: EF-P lysine aminoacylase EpmA [Proteobacteria bacterium]|nr:EF-P lysine aminoacylase EpmA [Pseudomonadota bacterium]